MSGADSFFDTSVLLYLLSSDTEKADRVEALLAESGVISVQVLNEFTAVASRKPSMPLGDLREVTARTQKGERKETALLVSEIDHASSLLDQADASGDTDTRLLFNAAESYQRIKSLLSRMDLSPSEHGAVL